MGAAEHAFQAGEHVRVKSGSNPGWNPRTPEYLKGRVGIITALHGVVSNPSDHRADYPFLYTIAFAVTELTGRPSNDQVFADVHEDWLERA